jgi:uncharacterized delta-60 repeat protein
MCTSTALRRRPLLSAICLGLLVAPPASGSPGGELDATFGENGRVTIRLAGESVGIAVAQQVLDAKLLIGGWTATQSTPDFAVMRLNADGTPDTAFGGSGTGVATVDFNQSDDVVVSVAVQQDGRILAAGWADMGSAGVDYDLAMARFNPDGSLDPTFDGDGRVTLDLGGSDEQVSGMTVLSDGQIVVAGFTDASGDYDVVFAGFGANGMLDPGFGTAGTTIVDSPGGTAHDQTFWMTRQPDGKYIACGLSGPGPYDATNGAMLAVRANANGSVDTTYGTNGVAIVQTPTVLGHALSCVALPDGSGATVLAGLDGNFDNPNLAFARLDANGNLDPAFGTAGRSSIDFGGMEVVQSIVWLNDGKLAVAGLNTPVDDDAPGDLIFTLIDADTGAFDGGFGNQGVTVADFGRGGLPSGVYGFFPHGYGLVHQADGRLVAVGTQLGDFDRGTPSGFAIARVDPAGAGNAGVVGFADTFAFATEGTANVVLTLRRTGGSVGALAVDYAFAAGTAQSPGDFTGMNGSVEWADGEVTARTITIPIANDTTVEQDEIFTVTLSGSAAVAFAATEATVIIVDNDVAPPPPPPPSGGGGGGGGATGIALLGLLAILNAFAVRHRRRPRGAPPAGHENHAFGSVTPFWP